MQVFLIKKYIFVLKCDFFCFYSDFFCFQSDFLYLHNFPDRLINKKLGSPRFLSPYLKIHRTYSSFPQTFIGLLSDFYRNFLHLKQKNIFFDQIICIYAIFVVSLHANSVLDGL